MLSVIVAVFEQVQTLDWLLQCLERQDYSGRFEVIVCDDGSAADIRSIIRSHSRSLDLEYVRQPHDGCVSCSRNNGIRCARGDILVFLDGDVLVESDFLSRHASAHSDSDILASGRVKRLVVGCDQWPAMAVSSMLNYASHAAGEYPENQEYWIATANPWMACVSGNLSVSRDPAIAFDETFVGWGCEDREFSYRLTRRGRRRVVYASDAIGYHVSLASDSSSRHLQTHEEIVAFLRNKLAFRSLYPEIDPNVGLCLLRHCYLDRRTGRWYRSVPSPRRTVADVIHLAEEWFSKQLSV